VLQPRGTIQLPAGCDYKNRLNTMQFGICDLSLIPLKNTPSHQSERVSQLLFGDSYEIISKQGDWVKIICDHDAYQGWIGANQSLILPDNL
jgi:gamma-D-glutamyl-L-lysine dipeptidyl-peptidase